jgi:Golgi nucleoside diphosphatase
MDLLEVYVLNTVNYGLVDSLKRGKKKREKSLDRNLLWKISVNYEDKGNIQHQVGVATETTERTLE